VSLSALVVPIAGFTSRALIVGFSQTPDDSAIPLQFAHEDAMNFARFLQLDHDGKLPGKSRFDDIEVRLLVAAPGMDPDSLSVNPKIKLMQDELGDQRLRVVYPHSGAKYDYLVRKSINEIISSISDTNRADRLDWEDVILIYYSGHGFSKYIPGPVPHMQVGLMTPDTDRTLSTGVIWIDQDLIVQLRNSNVISLIIVDACSSEIRQPGVEGLSVQRTQLKLPIYEDANVHGRTELQFLFGSEVGTYSYEQSDFGIGDFIPNLSLWPSDVGTKGSSVFSLGLLTSLLCQEAGEDNSYTFATSSHFLRTLFFRDSNSKWRSGIRPKLEEMMNRLGLAFVSPVPRYFGFPGGDGESTTLRSVSSTAPKCGFPASN
jgi:hypothetical protein